MQEITNHVRFIDNGNGVEVICDGESIATVAKDDASSDSEIYLDDLVKIRFEGKNAVVYIVPMMFSSENPMGTTLGIAKITYSSNEYGTFEVSDFAYYEESNIEELLSDYIE